ncbi:MAG TPA: hypothetical protein VGM96_10805 [Reyranella sp.]|jgi:CRISPR/Cas system CMR subunit Cmr4 (Cas7 group RAMP superfamily)
MITLHSCPHGQARLRQRGFRSNDHELIFAHGVAINDNEIVMPETVTTHEIALRQLKMDSLKRRGVARNAEVAALKREIHQFERIRNRKIVVDEDVLVTAYRPSQREMRRCFRRLRGGK